MGNNARFSSNEPQEIAIRDEYITLGQLLKFVGIVDEGGEAKGYLSSHEVKVNGLAENRRGRKLRANDLIEAEGRVLKIKGQ
jgi:ribosome-associated protein